MAIFSRAVDNVSDVNCFARIAGDRQTTVISIRLSCEHDTALIVPIPSVAGSGREALKLLRVDTLAFFGALRQGFSRESTHERRVSTPEDEDGAPRTVRFTTTTAYDTLYLPSIEDFDLVLPEYRLSDRLTGAFSPYLDYGFAVFKLRGGKNMRLGPIAFSFPTRDQSHLYFPTFQFHDGVTRGQAHFDAALYAQAAEISDWQTTRDEAGAFMDVEPVSEIVDSGRTIQRCVVYGEKTNEDIWLAV